MPVKKSAISIRTIQKVYLLNFEQVMSIVKEEGWKTIDCIKMTFDKQTVIDCLAARGIKEKTIDWRGMVKQFGVPKERVFDLIREQQWQPLSTGETWVYPIEPVIEYFKNNNQK